MVSVVTIWLCFSLVLLPVCAALERQRESLWSFQRPGDIILHALYPLRKRINPNEACVLNFEGIAWMGAMIHRVDQINKGKLLPGNLTLGYEIRDTGCDVKMGLRQSLSVLDEIVNKERGKQNNEAIPVVLGPAMDDLMDTSANLYETFKVPRVSYTTTSSRFGNKLGTTLIRTVPSDLIHVEALVRVLNHTKAHEVSVVVSDASPWKERVKIFQTALKERESRTKVKEVVQLNTVADVNVVLQRITCEVAIVFAQANISRSLIRNEMESKPRTWIQVSPFDDPLLQIFDSGKPLKEKVIIRNLRRNDADTYSRELTETLHSSGKIVKPHWLRSLFEKHCETKTSRTSAHNGSAFKKRISLAIGHRNGFRSSLTLQGIIDGVNLIIASLKETLEQCVGSTPRHCGKLSGSTLFKKLRRVTEKKDFENSYSIQMLRRVEDTRTLGRRMEMTRGWTFRKVREWPISGSYVRDKLRVYCDNEVFNTACQTNDSSIRQDNDLINDFMNSSNSDSCIQCSKSMNQSKCIADDAVINWTDTWAIVLYILECICLLAVFSTFVYFQQHKNSPIMILCYSWPDDIVLPVLCLFSLLPMMHIGEMAANRCVTLWPIINVIFAFYCGLLLTKTLVVQNLLKCEVATERPGRRMAFTTLITLVQILVLASLLVFDFPGATHFACSSRGTLALCNIEGNIGIVVAMAFNWLLLCTLFTLSATETLKQRQNFCRTENLVAVATVALLSYSCLIALAYFNIQIEHYLAVTLIQCVIYLINSAVCLGLIYVPTLRLVSTWLRQHTRQKRNLTSIKRAQVMSSKRQSSGPIRDSLLGATDQLTIPSGRHSGYYFDLRPASAVTDMSYPTSLVRSVHEQTHVVFGYGRRDAMSTLNGATSVESVPSMDWLDAPSQAQSASSSYDNLSRAAEETADELSPQELLHEISTYWERHRSSDVIANGQNENNVETNKWPSLEKLRTSDL